MTHITHDKLFNFYLGLTNFVGGQIFGFSLMLSVLCACWIWMCSMCWYIFKIFRWVDDAWNFIVFYTESVGFFWYNINFWINNFIRYGWFTHQLSWISIFLWKITMSRSGYSFETLAVEKKKHLLAAYEVPGLHRSRRYWWVHNAWNPFVPVSWAKFWKSSNIRNEEYNQLNVI